MNFFSLDSVIHFDRSDLQLLAFFIAEKWVGPQYVQIVPALCKDLTILITTPVGNVSCGRSFLALRRLKL